MSFHQMEEQDYNLLIIDDEIEITKSIARQFRKKYKVFSATSAKEGLDIMEKEHIQVILSDQRMPDMSGVDFFSVIKDKYPDALKLLITGYSDIEAVIGAINEGQVFRYVTKPWNPDELESIVREAFEKYELITNNRRLMLSLQDSNIRLEEKVKIRTSELEKLNSRLYDLNQEKNRYIGMVAHDLRNPIGIAEAFSGTLLEDFDTLTKSSQLEYIGLINKSCSFSLDLIHEFLDISKIEAGIFDLNLSHHNYLSFLTDNVKRNEMLARNKSQRIVIETSLPEIKFCFDKNKIEQVLNNLLGNAMKYSAANTQIQIEVSSSDQWMTTKIVDEGQGIPQDELEKVFHPYQTTSVKATANEKSTGLGLAIVKKIIESHHGEISVESEVGKGSVFSFKIPLVSC
jgi:signal transduction histidine kinase